ncbi:MAG: hypothetical protein WDA75_07315 [Candidatus Latescibacterota bacterium]|jgi:hypothetical protein
MTVARSAFTCLFLAVVLAGTASPVAASDWTGVWHTNWGRMLMWQDGNQVRGTYDWEDGRIEGHVEGDRLYFIWREEPTYAGQTDAGPGYLDMSLDGQSFSGAWGLGEQMSWSTMIIAGGWDGTRRAATGVAAILGEPAVEADASGRATVSWTTSIPSSTRCQWGASQAYELGEVSDPALSTAHDVAITDLRPGQAYHVRVGSYADNEAYTEPTWSDDIVVAIPTPTGIGSSPWGRIKGGVLPATSR